MRYSKPHTEFTDDGLLRLESEYVLGIPFMDAYLTIPVNFIWDGASIPKAFWFLVGHPYDEKVIVASLAHDWLCSRATTYAERVFADAVFFFLLAAQGMAYWRRALMYAAVRIWGRLTYWRML